MKNIFVFAALMALLTGGAQAQMPKGRTGVFAIRNATVIPVTQDTFVGNVIIRDGKIADLGPAVAIPADAEVIDGTNKYVYPGLIDGGTYLGLQELRSIDLTQDFDEVGEIIPQMQALTAVNPNSALIPVNRASGVTTVLTAPRGTLIPGTSALINLHGYTPDQMYAGFKGVVMEFPSTGRGGRFDRRSEEDIQKDADKKVKQLTELWTEVELYGKVDSAFRAGKGEAPAYRPDLAALLPVVKGEAPLLIEVNAASDILNALKWIKEKKVKAVLMGVAEGWRVAAAIAEAGTPVITGPVLGLPTRESDRYDRPYRNAGALRAAGVTVAIRTREAENVRNLPFHAGFAAAYGMGKEAALEAVTIVPARIFGVDAQIGSLEKGKIATLFVSDGDPFETHTQVTQVFIAGWLMPDDNRQLGLYREFLERDPGVKK